MKYTIGKNPNSRNGFKKGDANVAKKAEVRAKISKALIGKKQAPRSKEQIAKQIEASIRARKEKGNFSGKGHPNYRDGKAPIRKRMYNTKYFQDWRKAVFERDDYTCVFCFAKGGQLHADHIKPFAYYPELRFELSNGRTLCVDCHKATPTYGFHKKEFIQP